jgi:hypothetical protein
MCVGAETEVKRYVPPRKGTLTLIITDGFTLKVLWIVCVLTVLLRGVVWLTEILWTTDCCVLSVQFARTCPRSYAFLTTGHVPRAVGRRPGVHQRDRAPERGPAHDDHLRRAELQIALPRRWVDTVFTAVSCMHTRDGST